MSPLFKPSRGLSSSCTCLCVLLLPWLPAPSAHGVTFTTNTSITAANLTYEGQDIVVSGCTVTIDGPHAFNNLTVANNGVVTHPAPAGPTTYSLNLTIAGNVQVDSGSKITGDGRGYPGNTGPGAGSMGSASYSARGAGYGGTGGQCADDSTPGGGPYGSVTQPTDLGSGGGVRGPAGAGGGAIRLIVTGTLTVSGTISANGAVGVSAGAGGGSGGSIWITAGTLGGSGAITANGGAGDPGGYDGSGGSGGGGRIAIYYGGGPFGGTITAYGADATYYGSAGTIFTKATSDPNGRLLIDNGGNSAVTQLGSAWLAAGTTPDFTIAGKTQVQMVTPLLTLNSLYVATNGQLTTAAQNALQMTVQTDATVDAGGAVTIDGRGYPGNTGPGAGSIGSAGYSARGAGYGGTGGQCADDAVSGGGTYGSAIQPTDLGSGGGIRFGVAGAGGGAIRLIVSGTLAVNGTISANGAAAPGAGAGGGSGGSLWITTGTLVGSGTIAANGGAGSPSGYNGSGGGGGGGRIAIYYSGSSFGGNITAYGGSGYFGGAGTVFTKAGSDPNGSLSIDNGGNSAATQLGTAWLAVGSLPNLTIAHKAVVQMVTPLTINRLHVAADGQLTQPGAQNVFQLTVQTDATIDAAGAINVDGQGYPQGAGPGAGSIGSAGYSARGAGYGGTGGRCADDSTAGGGAYGSVTQPTDLGSSGGNRFGVAGAGGGAIRLIVAGFLAVNGTVSANGAAGPAAGAGGGSGGSIWITTGALVGSGAIAANGGAGSPNGYNGSGGGGGGGRIAIYYSGNPFGGNITAYGGSGYYGGAGTVFTKVGSDPNGSLLIDNGGNSGVTQLGTAWLSAGTAPDFTIANMAVVRVVASLTFNSLHVAANAQLTHPAAMNTFQVTVQKDATVDAGGAITADGLGYPVGTGPGAGGIALNGYSASGAGYGGAGGPCPYGWGGGAYGSVTAPVDFGSGGGNRFGMAGAGGGAIRLIVLGTLAVNGTISANGTAAPGAGSGGGSGGSIWITTGTLVGTGSITANGGAGDGGGYGAGGGGGAGGRIAIYYDSNPFGGTVTAPGAPGGYNSGYYGSGGPGGAGTVWLDFTGDVSGDGAVDVLDLLYLVDAFGTYTGDAKYNPACDFNSDGAVDVLDLLYMVYNFGKSL